MNFKPSKEDLYIVVIDYYGLKACSRHIPTAKRLRKLAQPPKTIRTVRRSFEVIRWTKERWVQYKSQNGIAARPKQWDHWLTSLGFYSHGRRMRRERQLTNFKGHGYVWRINCHDMLQCGDAHDEFDRWALCSIVETPVPKTRKELQQKVNALLEVKRQIEAGEMDKPEYGSIVVD